VVDWAEWQAGYAGAALLMPESFIRRAAEAYFADRKEHPPVAKDSADASTLAQRISLAFDVSAKAATVRLRVLKRQAEIETLVVRGRKRRLCAVLGFQAITQLRTIYGHDPKKN
jgi:Zn-dependent peptidase ImmA (M78 family)